MRSNRIEAIYRALFDRFGPQHWWPGETPLEIMIGAILTQNTNWKNVSRAIDQLRQAGLLDFDTLASAPVEQLAELIRPSGYYNLKAARLGNLITLIREQFSGSLDRLFAADNVTLRQALLAVRGIGPETADSIMLYAAHRPVFVVDAYTHRILFRHHLVPEESTYPEIQQLFNESLPEDTVLFNEYHALLVRLGKEYCRKSNPACAECPVRDL